MLRKYQKLVVEQAVNAMKSGAKSVLIVAPTGSGKTKMITEIIKRMKFTPLALAHRVEIVRGIEKEFQSSGVKRSVVRGILSKDTLRIVGTKNNINCVFIDEAHHIAANTYQTVLKCNKDKIVLGATATPFRADGVCIEQYFDAVVHAPTHTSLVAEGFLADLTFYSPLNIDFDDVKNNIKGDFDASGCLDKLRIVVQAGKINGILDEYKCRTGTLIYAVNIEHCSMIKDELQSFGKKCAILNSRTNKTDRKQMIKDFESGVIKYIINCEVLTEGTDIRGVENILMVRPTKSIGLYKQIIGRGARPDCDCTIIDLVGNVERFGDVFSSHSFKKARNIKVPKGSSPVDNTFANPVVLHVEQVEAVFKKQSIHKGLLKFAEVYHD